MSGPISIGSVAEWQSLLSGTNVVVADFYADWCGPCKMIAPHFERLAKEHSRPKKVAFAKVNVDTQSAIARTNGVSAMPTFKIFHGGNCVDTIKGANPSALSEAIGKAVKLSDTAGAGKPGDAFKTPGRTLGGEAPATRGATGPSFNFSGLLNILVVFVGLYLFDARKAAESSWFNVHKVATNGRKTPSGPAGGQGGAAKAPAQKPAFRTLADLGSE
ncbi:thioredoxin [Purpureocillium lavendulum]|uniref:Thioredoxin n=1 Tax=Purpureocillium lavendulum TaxID=1247861 RepID=A0AB34G564_9HYPO|nr:thioredoxin [Purpureocillium lavendulum]